ncbi:hypothetical protein KHQ06_33430 [Nocardia tengchongensis]|uniref:PknH-like protein n=1 Tax=Nocardia tengchongensis TaxID=2055889 RepID=A0ABX8CLT3_9NOCA|nr:hypothetical protein [Nocardia tengchongensis]QVI20929.1 hypothetical protein KHQ06_33430 [Nocardia tengchongensis]
MDQKKAEYAVQVVGEVLKSFEATSDPKSGPHANAENLAFTSKIVTCLGVAPASLGPIDAYASSPTYADTAGAVANIEVDFAPTAAGASSFLAAAHDDKMSDCLAKQAESGGLSDVTVAKLSFPKSGDDTIAFRTTATKTGRGRTVYLSMDLVVVRVGHGLVYAVFAQGSQIPQSFLSDWAHDAVRRVSDRVASGH